MIATIIIVIIVLIIAEGVLFFKISGKCNDSGGTLFLYTINTIILGAFLAGLMECCVEPQPTALDVYRGNTELQIKKTYINDTIEKCDTIVVFKKIN